ncbi:uncharacterized protein KD926_010164 [Aspergillus affinis]|uniref:uncharacterized protein n=1 Tax=Aspergillus affinis TaxID=1070780 RepID=UPI0022FE2F7E|nr:uncharacterized protein KD926_010164 [Aspergillus affinis]KAI9038831.1 hypothetical protein KD926_010164 [Aspergillus affinis]
MAKSPRKSGMTKSQPIHRRSARIRVKEGKSSKAKTRPPSPKLQQPKANPVSRKRKRGTETEPKPSKRQKKAHERLSRQKSIQYKDIIRLQSVKVGLKTNKATSILYWIQHETWPEILFEADSKKNIENLISSTSESPTELTENAERQHTDMERFLNSKGSYLTSHGNGIAKNDALRCIKLLERGCETPRDTIFENGDSFNYIKRILPERNEIAVTQVIGQLVVPWAEIGIVRGQVGFTCLIDSVKELWDGSISLDEIVHGQQLDAGSLKGGQYQMPIPQPDYSVGFLKEAFTKSQIEKLAPFLGGFYSTSPFKGTAEMLFPFLVVEVKCGKVSLELADRQNAHSMSRALKGVVDIFRLVKREKELHRQVLGFSISHNHDHVRIYGHYSVIEGEKTTYYRHSVRAFSITARNGKERWTSYKFVMALYNDWVPAHFQRLSSAVDDLPAGVNFDKISSKSAQSHRNSEVL